MLTIPPVIRSARRQLGVSQADRAAGTGFLALLAVLNCALWLPTALIAQNAENPPTPSPAMEDASTVEGPCADGMELFRAQEYGRAEPLLVRCAEEEGRIEPLVLLTVITVMTERFDEAVTWGKRAVDLGPQEADARYWYGRALLVSGDEEAAQQQWEAGLLLDTNHPGLLEGLARLALDQNEDAKAYGLLNQMRTQGATDAWIHEMLSDLARRKGLWSTALEHWQDVIVQSGENPENLVVAGELAILAGDTATAIAVCEQAVALGGSAEAYGTLGEALFAADRYQEALTALQQAIVMDPDQPRYLFNAANILEIFGRVDEAEEYFVKYIALVPDDAVGHFNYGIHLDKLDRPQAALEQVNQAISLNPDWLAARIIEAQLLERLGRYEDAIAAIDSVKVRDSESPEELLAWRERLEARIREVEASELAGQVHLLHIVSADTLAIRLIEEELSKGTDFAVLATRFSTGPTAAQGGDIGWVAPEEMVESLRSTIEALSLNEISPLVEAKGLYHYFKRIR